MIDVPTLRPPVYVYRAPKKGELTVQLVSASWYAHSTHFTHRTRLCPGGDNCPLCQESISPRWLAWIAAVHKGAEDTGLLEMTSYVADTVGKHLNQAGDLAGLIVTMTRGRKMWPDCSGFASGPVRADRRRDAAWVRSQVRRLMGVPDTDTWVDAAAALIRHDMSHGLLAASCA